MLSASSSTRCSRLLPHTDGGGGPARRSDAKVKNSFIYHQTKNHSALPLMSNSYLYNFSNGLFTLPFGLSFYTILLFFTPPFTGFLCKFRPCYIYIYCDNREVILPLAFGLTSRFWPISTITYFFYQAQHVPLFLDSHYHDPSNESCAWDFTINGCLIDMTLIMSLSENSLTNEIEQVFLKGKCAMILLYVSWRWWKQRIRWRITLRWC